MSRLAALLASTFLAASSAFAQATYYWDPLHSFGTGSDGSGTWDLSTANFSNGPGDFVWNNSANLNDIVVFGAGGAPGTVTLAVPINAGGLTFNSSYTLTGGSLTLANAAAANGASSTGAQLTTGAGVSATINSSLIGSGDITKAGSGTLTLSDIATTGRFYLTGGTLVSSGASNSVAYLRAIDGGTVGLAINPGTSFTVTGNPASGVATMRVINGTTLNLSGGGNLNVASGAIGVGLNGLGNGTINQSAGTLDFDRVATGDYAYLFVGGGAGVTGTYNQSGSSVVKTGGALIIGADSGTGIYTLAGNSVLRTGDTWTGGFHIYLGLNQSAGQTGTNGTLTIGGSSQFLLGATSFLDVGSGFGVAGGTGTITQNGAGSVATFGGAYAGFGSQSAGGTGTYNLQAGTLNFTAGTIAFGDTAGATGVLNQSGGTLVAGVAPIIGNQGTGTYNLSNGTATFNAGLTIGANSGSAGSVIQTGGTATIAGGTLLLGQTNSLYEVNGGTLAIGNGATLQINSATMRVGTGAGSNGLLTLGAGGTINLDASNGIASLRIGRLGGTGTFNMTGGTVNAASSTANGFSLFFIGGTASNGTVNQSGGTITGAATTIVGADLATGTYNLSGNAVFQSPDSTLPGSHVYVGLNQVDPGASNTTTGTVSISGNASFTMRAQSYLDVGRSLPDGATFAGGRGFFVQTGGTATFAGDFAAWGSTIGGYGQYDLSGGALNFNNGTVSFGQNAGATGVLNQTGGTLVAATGVTIGNQGTGTYNLSAGTATFNSGLAVGAAAGSSGTVNQSGGTLTIGGGQLLLGQASSLYNLTGGTLQVGGANGVTGAGSVTLGGGTILVTGSALTTSVNATLMAGTLSTLNTNGLGATWAGNISGLTAGLVKAGAGDLTLSGTDSIGTFAITGGSVTQTAGSLSSRELLVGTGAGNTGAYNFVGGTITLPAGSPPFGGSAPSLRVGDFGGTGTFTQTGGTITAAGSLNIGNQGGAGTYNLSGGTLNLNDVNGLTSLGRTNNATATSGTLNISGTGTLNASIDSFIVGDREINGANGTALITQTGGVFSIQGGTRLYLGGYGSSTYNLNGGRLEVGGGNLQGLFTGQGANTTGSYAFNLGGGTILVTGSALNTSVNANLAANVYSTINTNGLGAVWSGNISGSQGGLIKAGAGDLALSGTNAIGSALITAGSVTQSAGAMNSNEIAVGTGAGNTASYVMNGGTMNLLPGTVAPIVGGPTAQSSLRVGDFGGTGTFTQNAGTVNVSGSLNVGNQGGSGTYNLAGGTLNLADGLYNLGRKQNASTASPSTGTLNISGGLLNVQNGNFILGSRDPGALSAASNGTVNQTGGIFRLSGTSTADALFLSGYGNGTYNLNGGALEVGGNALQTHYGPGSGTYAFNMNGGTVRVINAPLASGVNTTLGSGTTSTIDTNGLGATWSGVIGGAGGNLTKAGSGILALTAPNTFTGTTTVSGGTLRAAGTGGPALGGTTAVVINGGTLLLGGDQQVNNAAAVTITNGTLATGNFNQNLGPLTVNGGGSAIDMDASGPNVLAFADSSAFAWTNTLSILNWTGQIVDPDTGAYISGNVLEVLRFGTTSGGLSPSQLGNIFFYSDNGATFVGNGVILGNGSVVAAVPEPSTYLAAALALGALGWHQRRRIRVWLSNRAVAQRA